MSFALAVASIWLSSCVTISVALYYTHNIRCLWFLLIPALVNISSKHDDTKEKETEDEETDKE